MPLACGGGGGGGGDGDGVSPRSLSMLGLPGPSSRSVQCHREALIRDLWTSVCHALYGIYNNTRL